MLFENFLTAYPIEIIPIYFIDESGENVVTNTNVITCASDLNYTVLLCVDFEENIIRHYNELLKVCEIQGATTNKFDNLYMTTRSLRITKNRTIQYNLVLALGAEDANDIAQRIYEEKGQIAVAFFDIQENMIDAVQSVRKTFSNLICAVAVNNDELTRPGDIFSSPSEWLYFSRDHSPERMEQLIAHLISSFVLHRENLLALLKNEANREALQQLLDAYPELLKNQTEQEFITSILMHLRMLTGALNTYLMIKDIGSGALEYVAGTGIYSQKETFQEQIFSLQEDFLKSVFLEQKVVEEKSGILAPLWVQGKPVGLLFLDRCRIVQGNDFIEVFAYHVAFAIENRRLQKEIEQKKAMEHELNLASRIQESLLPKTFPDIPSLDIYGITQSAKEIGGDYFDVLSSNDNDNYYFCIGDVSGKGVPAGLIMSELRSIVRAFSMTYNSPKEILLQSAQLLLQDIGGSGKFVSMLLFQWDGKSLIYSSAGHEHILHYHAATGVCDAYRSGGVVLGVDYRNFSRLVKEKSLDWEKGDIIILFTDGATEAKNEEGDMYKLPNLQKAVEKYHSLPVTVMIEAILKELKEFIGKAIQHDDITLLGIKFL